MSFGDPSVGPDDPEPSLDELFRDPIFQGLLRSDGVSRAELLRLVSVARQRLGGRRCLDCAA